MADLDDLIGIKGGATTQDSTLDSLTSIKPSVKPGMTEAQEAEAVLGIAGIKPGDVVKDPYPTVGKLITEQIPRGFEEVYGALTAIASAVVAEPKTGDITKFWFDTFTGSGGPKRWDDVADAGGEIAKAAVEPFVMMAKDPLGYTYNRPIDVAASIGMLAGGGGALTKAASGVVKNVALAEKLAKVGAVMEASGVYLDPVAGPIKGLGKGIGAIADTPIGGAIARSVERFELDAKAAKLLNKTDKQAFRDLKLEYKNVNEALTKLGDDGARNLELWVRGLTRPINPSKEMSEAYTAVTKFLDGHSDEFGFKEIGNMQGIVDNALATKKEAITSRAAKVGDDSFGAEVDRLVEKLSSDPESPNVLLKPDDAMAWARSKADPELLKKYNSVLLEQVADKLDLKRLEGNREDIILRTVHNDQRAYQDLAVASGMRSWDDFAGTSSKRFLSSTEIDELKKVNKAFYFPDKASISKPKMFEKLFNQFGRKESIKGDAKFLKRRTGAAQESGELLDTKTALAQHAMEVAAFKGKMKFVTGHISELAKKGLVRIAPRGTTLPGMTAVDLKLLQFHDSAQLALKKNILDNLEAGNGYNQIMDDLLENAKKISEEGQKQGFPVVFVPDEEAGRLRGLVNRPGNAFTSVLDATDKGSKAIFLALSPAWHISSAVGNLALNTIGGVGPTAYARLFPKFVHDALKAFGGMDSDSISKIMGGVADKAASKYKNFAKKVGIQSGREDGFFIWDEDLFPAELEAGFHSMNQYGVDNIKGIVDEASNKFVVKNKGFVSSSYELGNAIDNYFRRASYVDKATKEVRRRAMEATGKSLLNTVFDFQFGKAIGGYDNWKLLDDKSVTKIVEGVEQFLFNYQSLGAIERNYIKKVFPFWPWFRNINKFMFYDLPAKFPIRRGVLSAISRVAQESFNNGDAPDWLRHSVRSGEDEEGNQLFLDFRGANPFAGAGRTSFRLMRGDVVGAIGSLNPLLNIPLERSFGVSSFTGKPFDSPDQAFGRPGFRRIVDPQSGEVRDEQILPDPFSHVMRMFEPYRVFEEYLAGGQVYDSSTLLNPKVKHANHQLQKAIEQIEKLKVMAPPRTPGDKEKRAVAIAKANKEYAELIKELGGEIARAKFDKGELVPTKPFKAVESMLNILGVNIVPINTQKFLEGKMKNKEEYIKGLTKELYIQNPTVKVDGEPIKVRELLNELSLQKAIDEGKKSNKRKRLFRR